MAEFQIVVEADPDVPQVVIEAVRKLAEMGELKYFSFPNASSYWKWVIPMDKAVGVGDAVAVLRYNRGICAEDNRAYYWVDEKEDLGPGADFGAHFFNRDQTGLKIRIKPGNLK